MCHLCEETLPAPGRLRRQLLLAGAGIAALQFAAPAAFARQPATLSFYHTHTGERLRLPWVPAEARSGDLLDELRHLLRDFRTGESHPIDPELFDILHRLREATGGQGTYEIISAYRSPHTNEMLRARGNGVAQRSLHMEGRAIDVRLRGVPTRRLREAALALQAGGVGYYPNSDFIHLDTGRVRFW